MTPRRTPSQEKGPAVSRTGRHRTTHQTLIEASAETVYQLIADAADWPLRFAPTVHVERTALDGSSERLRIWAVANGEVKHWTSRRVLDREHGRVEFRQEVSAPPVALMGGAWVVQASAAGPVRLTLEHDFEAVDDEPESVAWITSATNHNSEAELGNIKTLAEGAAAREAVFAFEDSAFVRGAPEEVYRFLYEAAAWPDRLPHVSRMDLREDVPNIQRMVMDTVTKDGSAHTTESVRICFPETRRIVYKQLVTPPLLAAHLGSWTVEPAEGGALAVSRHTVRINEAAIGPVLGADAGLEAARDFVRRAVGGNSAATLALAKDHVEDRRG